MKGRIVIGPIESHENSSVVLKVAWFISGYRLKPDGMRLGRYCAVDDYTPDIEADGGSWAETEVLGQRAIVKASASEETLARIAADVMITRLPGADLDAPLRGIPAAQKVELRQLAVDLGYPGHEIAGAMPGGSIGGGTLRHYLELIGRRRRKIRYEYETGDIIDDGPVQTPRSLESVDREV